jgi:hypothetical protein
MIIRQAKKIKHSPLNLSHQMFLHNVQNFVDKFISLKFFCNLAIKKQPKYNPFGSFFLYSPHQEGRSWYLRFHFPPAPPGPLGLLGVGPKHKPFVFCPHYWGAWYPDLRGRPIATGPTSFGRFLTITNNLWFWLF